MCVYIYIYMCVERVRAHWCTDACRYASRMIVAGLYVTGLYVCMCVYVWVRNTLKCAFFSFPPPSLFLSLSLSPPLSLPLSVSGVYPRHVRLDLQVRNSESLERLGKGGTRIPTHL